VIRFSAALVVVAVGVLVGGIAASSLLLVYVAIGLSVVALLTLALGVALKREEIFGEQGQSALVGQGANASFGQEHPGSAASAERSAAPGKQDAFGQQATAFGQAAWAAAPDMHSGQPGVPWPPPAAPATPGPKIPPRREQFASPAPQPAAQPGADVAQTRLDTALTPMGPAKTRADLTEAKAGPSETKADTAPARPAALNWFERIAPARPAAGDIKTEDADAADPPADEAAAAKDAGETTVEDAATVTAGDEEEAATASTNAAADTVVENTVVENTVVEPSAAGSDAEPEAKDGAPAAPAEAADSSPDGDQEGPSGQREVTVVPGVPRYHDANCILIRFMGDDDLQKMTLDEAAKAACTPCRACMPEHA
jgi:hypothetical protein